MGRIKLSLLGREHLSTALIVLRNSLKIFHITKRDFLPLNCLPVEQQIFDRCCRSDLNRVETRLPCSFWTGNLKRDFYTYTFFWKYSKLNIDFENTLKNREKVFTFWDNCMWMGCIKLSLLGREHLSTALIVLTNSLKLLHITKRDFLQLNCLLVDQ